MRRPALVALAALGLAACGGGEPSAGSAAAPDWQALAGSTLARTEVAAARVGRHVYVMGGFERDSGATTAATERYDIQRDRWTRVADMPVALNHAAAAAYRGKVYVLGGYRDATGLTAETAALYRYDPARDRWSRLPQAPTARGALAVGVIGHKLYAAGGAAAGAALDTLEIYDLRRGTWRRGPDMEVAARAPRRRGGRRPLLRAGGPRHRGRELRRRRGLRPGCPPLAPDPVDAQAARRDRRRDGRRPDRGRRRGGDGGHDPRGRALRPRAAPLARAARPADAAPRPRARWRAAGASTSSRAATIRASRSRTASKR